MLDKFPQQTSDRVVEVFHLALDSLEQQLKKKNPEFQLIAGAIKVQLQFVMVIFLYDFVIFSMHGLYCIMDRLCFVSDLNWENSSTPWINHPILSCPKDSL